MSSLIHTSTFLDLDNLPDNVSYIDRNVKVNLESVDPTNVGVELIEDTKVNLESVNPTNIGVELVEDTKVNLESVELGSSVIDSEAAVSATISSFIPEILSGIGFLESEVSAQLTSISTHPDRIYWNWNRPDYEPPYPIVTRIRDIVGHTLLTKDGWNIYNIFGSVGYSRYASYSITFRLYDDDGELIYSRESPYNNSTLQSIKVVSKQPEGLLWVFYSSWSGGNSITDYLAGNIEAAEGALSSNCKNDINFEITSRASTTQYKSTFNLNISTGSAITGGTDFQSESLPLYVEPYSEPED